MEVSYDTYIFRSDRPSPAEIDNSSSSVHPIKTYLPSFSYQQKRRTPHIIHTPRKYPERNPRSSSDSRLAVPRDRDGREKMRELRATPPPPPPSPQLEPLSRPSQSSGLRRKSGRALPLTTHEITTASSARLRWRNSHQIWMGNSSDVMKTGQMGK